MWKDWDPHTLLVEILNGSFALENCRAAPQNVKHRVTICPEILLLGYIPKRSESMGLHKNMCINVHGNTIGKTSKGETT